MRYSNPDFCKFLTNEVIDATDVMRHLLNIPQSFEDSKYLTTDLLEQFEGLAQACQKLSDTFKHGMEHENFKCKDMDALMENVSKRI